MKSIPRSGLQPTIFGTTIPSAIRHLAWLAPLVCACNASALTWDLNGPTNNWSTNGADTNWTGGVTWTNGSIQALFGGTSGENITVSTVTTNELIFNNTGTAYNLSGGIITINNGVASNKSINATADATISSNININGAQTWAVSAGKTLNLGNINAAAVNTDMGFAGMGSHIINGSIGGNVRTVYLNGASGDTTNLTFTQANTFTGNLWLGYVAGSSTTLNFSDVNQLGSGTGGNFIAIQNAATLNYTGIGSQSATGRDLFWNAGTATISVANVNANLTLGATGGTRNQNFTKTGAGTLTLNSTATITGGTLTVNGGTLVVQSANTSGTAGTTTVSAGKLLVNNTTGFGTGTGAVSVASGATLGGTGTVGGAVTVSGVLAPGASIESLAANSSVTFNNSSTYAYELTTSVVNGDLLTVNGGLDLNGTVNLTLTDLGALTAVAENTVLTLINYSGTWNGGLFTLGGNQLTDGETFSLNGQGWTIDYNSTTDGVNFSGETTHSKYVNLTAVPEPATALLGCLGMLVLLRRRRA